MKPVRVLIADDHPLIIEGLTMVLQRHAIEVICATTTTKDVLKSYAECKPDVLVLDVRFGEPVSGLDVARDVIHADPEARIVFYSQFDQDEIVREAYRIGGAAFITKNTLPDVLADAIKQVSEGKTHFLPEIAERLALIGVRGDDSPQAKLDGRELEVFKQIAQGYTNAEIAESMGLSLKTISVASQSIKDKLAVHRPADITRLAIKHKVIEP
jgi:two-component system, NarL family, invasion response regulator UvrY